MRGFTDDKPKAITSGEFIRIVNNLRSLSKIGIPIALLKEDKITLHKIVNPSEEAKKYMDEKGIIWKT